MRSAMSIGAKYSEVDGAESKKDFRLKIVICKKTERNIALVENDSLANPKTKCRILWKEAQELMLLFSGILLGRRNRKRK